jgi:hypothetical protein
MYYDGLLRKQVMTQDEIIEMAKQAGFFINDELTITSPFIEDICISPMLKEFAKLVAAKERERLAQEARECGGVLTVGAILARGEA